MSTNISALIAEPSQRSLRKAVRFALLTGATLVASSAMTAQAADQSTISEVIVTGSRIERPDFESASPIVSVGEELFESTATLSVETLLNSLPQFVPSITNTSNNPSNGGQANVELRGLGTSRTLVLLDGRRVVPSNATGVVDLNLFPPALISNVEIISGGASAVYGSDAIAGVVNFKTKDMEGIEFETNYGQTSESDGEEMQFSLSGGFGFADGRGKFIGNITYADREQLLAGERNTSNVALGFNRMTGMFEPQGSPSVEEGSVTLASTGQKFLSARDQIFAQYGVPAGRATGNGFGFNTDGTLFTLGDGATAGSVVNFRGPMDAGFNDRAFSYNFAPTNYLQLPLERTSGFLRGTFDINDQAQVYLQALGGTYEADQQLAPTPVAGLLIPVSNPFVPADLRALALARDPAPANRPRDPGPNANLSINKRLSELNPRFANNEYTVYQAISGVKGDIGSKWSYDVYGSYGKVEIDQAQLGSISLNAVEQLTFAADGGASICGGFNPFGKGSISKECADFVTVDALNTTEVEQTIAEAVVTGPLFSVPAGEVSAAFGLFYKKDEFAFIADEKLRAVTVGIPEIPDPANPAGPPLRPGTSAGRADVAGFNASANTVGDTDSTEFYLETLVPILKDMPGAKRLELNLGYRYADYSTVGGVDSYKSELTYQPLEVLTLRGSYQRAVRAPNIAELFTPSVTNFATIPTPEPCDVNSTQRKGPNAAQVAALCLAQGIPQNLIGTFRVAGSQVRGLASGNPNLEEETSDSFTYGLVYRPQSDNRFLSNLQLSVDYYRIEIEDAIQAIPAGTFVPNCYDPAKNPNFQTDNFFCNFFKRNPVDGTVFDALELQQNVARVETAGVDVQVDWAADLGAGRLSLNLLGSWLDKFDRQDLQGEDFVNLVDTIGNTTSSAYPRWKGTLGATYSMPFGLSVNTRLRYIDNARSETVRTFTIPSITYTDLTVAYQFPESVMENLSVRLGVLNLTDRDPILYAGTVQNNTDPSTYDVLGRRFFLRATLAFK